MKVLLLVSALLGGQPKEYCGEFDYAILNRVVNIDKDFDEWGKPVYSVSEYTCVSFMVDRFIYIPFSGIIRIPTYAFGIQGYEVDCITQTNKGFAFVFSGEDEEGIVDSSTTIFVKYILYVHSNYDYEVANRGITHIPIFLGNVK